METDSGMLRALSDYGILSICNRSQDDILLSLGYYTNLYRKFNQIWQTLIHRPTPVSFLRVAACDLFTNGQYKRSHGKRIFKFRTKVEKLYPVLRCVNLVITILEIRFNNESGGIASL